MPIRLLSERAFGAKKTLWMVVGILVLAGILRFANIGWSYSNNGIDEGIMAERAMLVRAGNQLYTELPSDQAPLAFYLGAALGGDIIDLRLFVAAMSMAAIAACMVTSRRIAGGRAMLVTGLLLSFDFAFVRESRLFSLDALSSVFLAFAFAVFVPYIERKSWTLLVLAGLLAGLSTATKLFGALGLLGMIVFLACELRASNEPKGKGVTAIIVLAVAAALPLLVFALMLGPSAMFQGMVVNQGGRGLDIYLKLSLVAYFGVNAAYALPLLHARALWKADPRTRALACIALVVLAFMVLQPLLFFHHLVLLSPVLAVLTGVVVDKLLKDRKSDGQTSMPYDLNKLEALGRRAVLAVLVASLTISYSLSVYGIVAQPEPLQVRYADWLRQVTAPEGYVISGDPTIPALAGRLVPPEVANVAYRQSPDITLDDLERAVRDYDPAVVIVCYRLNEMDGLEEFLGEQGYSPVYPGFAVPDNAVLDLFQEGIGPVSVFVRGP